MHSTLDNWRDCWLGWQRSKGILSIPIATRFASQKSEISRPACGGLSFSGVYPLFGVSEAGVVRENRHPRRGEHLDGPGCLDSSLILTAG